MQDHYKTLGVMSSAEELVIEAAYKALVRKYHPDIYHGDKDYAKKRLQEINEAWSVLTDPAKRNQYNESFSGASNEFSGNGHSSGSVDPEWEFVLSYYPDLRRTSAALREISVELDADFRSRLLLSKQFSHRTGLAKKLEEEYLEKKFGANQDVQRLARAALKQKQRGFAQELNVAIKRLGEDEIDIILRRLAAEYPEFSKNYYVIHNFGHLLDVSEKKSHQRDFTSGQSATSPTRSEERSNNSFSFFLILLAGLALIFLMRG